MNVLLNDISLVKIHFFEFCKCIPTLSSGVEGGLCYIYCVYEVWFFVNSFSFWSFFIQCVKIHYYNYDVLKMFFYGSLLADTIWTSRIQLHLLLGLATSLQCFPLLLIFNGDFPPRSQGLYWFLGCLYLIYSQLLFLSVHSLRTFSSSDYYFKNLSTSSDIWSSYAALFPDDWFCLLLMLASSEFFILPTKFFNPVIQFDCSNLCFHIFLSFGCGSFSSFDIFF